MRRGGQLYRQSQKPRFRSAAFWHSLYRTKPGHPTLTRAGDDQPSSTAPPGCGHAQPHRQAPAQAMTDGPFGDSFVDGTASLWRPLLILILAKV
jgi:hypothetical protein